jgi:hypothetical protein
MVSVVILSADEDTAILRHRLRDAGFKTAGIYLQEVEAGAVDLRRFFADTTPDIVMCDLPSSPKPRASLLQSIQRLCADSGARCILTLPEHFDVRNSGLPDLDLDSVACVLVRPCDFELTRLAIGCALQGEIEGDEASDEDDEMAA